MPNVRVTTYSFNPTDSQVTLTGINPVDLGGLSIIVDVTTGLTLWLPTPPYVATVSGSVITLNASVPMAGLSSGDKLLILYDGGEGWIPLSPGQHNLAVTTASGLTAPAGATMATVQINGGNGKYTTDGTTTPTATVGQTLYAGQSIQLTGRQLIANFQVISASGTLDVEYFQ